MTEVLQVTLLTNAIKYSPGGGPVTLNVSKNGQVGKISVTDTGVGIPADRFDRLFTRFGRIVTPETSHIPGTGLGLYLSRELARLHGEDTPPPPRSAREARSFSPFRSPTGEAC